jgi:hypothetical protein
VRSFTLRVLKELSSARVDVTALEELASAPVHVTALGNWPVRQFALLS